MVASPLVQLLIGVAAASLIAILLMLTLVIASEAKIRAPHFGQLFCGCLFLFIGLRGLWWARSAIPHHTLWLPRYPNWQFVAWMDPWQAAVAFTLLSMVGIVVLTGGIRRSLRSR